MKVFGVLVIIILVFCCLIAAQQGKPPKKDDPGGVKKSPKPPKSQNRALSTTKFQKKSGKGSGLTNYTSKPLVPTPDVKTYQTNQKLSMISIDQLGKFERKKMALTVTFDENVVPDDWLLKEDAIFRSEVAGIMNQCQPLKMQNKKFQMDDVTHVSISPYVYDDHLSVTIMVYDPHSTERKTFIPGSVLFKCVRQQVTPFQNKLNTTTIGVYVGLREAEYLNQCSSRGSLFTGGIVTGILVVLAFYIRLVIKRWKICARLQNNGKTISRGFRRYVGIRFSDLRGCFYKSGPAPSEHLLENEVTDATL